MEIESIIEEWLRNPNVNGIITTGGTGLGFRDVTPETIEPYFTKKIDGFGELFRMISYTEDVGIKSIIKPCRCGDCERQSHLHASGFCKSSGARNGKARPSRTPPYYS